MKTRKTPSCLIFAITLSLASSLPTLTYASEKPKEKTEESYTWKSAARAACVAMAGALFGLSLWAAPDKDKAPKKKRLKRPTEPTLHRDGIKDQLDSPFDENSRSDGGETFLPVKVGEEKKSTLETMISSSNILGVRQALLKGKRVKDLKQTRRDLNRAIVLNETNNPQQQLVIEQILNLINLSEFDFENSISASRHYANLPDSLAQYMRVDMRGDGNCWLSGLWYITLTHLVKNPDAMYAFRVQVRTHGTESAYTVLDALHTLSLSLEDMHPSLAVQDIMTEFRFTLAFREFAHEIINLPGTGESRVGFLPDSSSWISNDADNERYIRGFTNYFQIPVYLLSSTDNFAFHIANHMSSDEKHNPELLKYLAEQRTLFLVSTKGHYTVLKP